MTPCRAAARTPDERTRLTTLLEDPLTRLVMERDRTDRDEILGLFADIRAARGGIDAPEPGKTC